MKADIKQLHTIEDKNIIFFNRDLSTVVKDLQLDGLEVEIQYHVTEENRVRYHSALIIGRGR